MPEENRFAGLSEAVDDDDAPGAEDVDEPGGDDEASADSAAVELEHDETDSATEPDDPSAFPFDATTKKTVYVRPETIDDLEDARVLVDAQLRTQHEVRNLTGREFYDAVFRLAAADTDGLVEELLDGREE